ncbi:hypothetical protein D1816_20120 [Aquimarina sp. AD10]|uniref:outer membrane beta-barrel protein n=1 Tax=Aquimarina sp. AD10 TaxID=1714849 RepID=UPI000E4BAFF8|nr:outer membrane beta-barrel protein [Aquimarina sp. AD10]AXT62568.1 hypothetical protein D1816_20120 [Aquimarina sp. AD10]RKM97752.1 hypothetical protein D7033_13435 [Aquimarina sp. AD10]
MKTIKINMLFLLMGLSCITAQTKGTSQVSVGCGYASYDANVQSFDFDNNDDDDENNAGAINVGYKYAVSDRWMLGGIIVYEKITNDINLQGETVRGTATVTTVGAEFDYRYISTQYFQMYSGFGVGYTFGNEKPTEDNINHFNCQLTGAGIRVGSTLAGFAELGFGYKGVINFGISLRF